MSIIIERSLLESFVIPCAISMVLEIAVMVFFLVRRYHTNYALLLVFYLTLANLLLSVGFMISAERLDPSIQFPIDASTFSCVLQTILVNVGQLSTSIWSAIISFILLRSFHTADVRTPYQLSVFLLLGFALPIVMTAVIFITRENGDTGYFCWLRIGVSLAENTVMVFLQFTVPTFLCILYSIVAVVRVLFKMRELQQQSSGVRRLLLYPVIATVCWVFRFVSRIQYIIYTQVSTWVAYTSLITMSIQGIITAVVYASNMKICKCSEKQQTEQPSNSNEVEMINVDGQDSSRSRSQTNPHGKDDDRPRFRSYSNLYR